MGNFSRFLDEHQGAMGLFHKARNKLKALAERIEAERMGADVRANQALADVNELDAHAATVQGSIASISKIIGDDH